MSQIEAIIFDWGGVLIDNPAQDLINYCANALGVSPQDYKKAQLRVEPAFTAGTISEKNFWRKICSELAVNTPQTNSLWYEAFKSVYRPRQEMFDLAGRLKNSGFKTALLTNTEMPSMKFFMEQTYTAFTALTFSCAENVSKPNPSIYKITLEKLNCPAESAVFIDDRPDFIEGAKAVRLKCILYRTFDLLIKDLNDCGIQTKIS
ncbi:MAG: HAD family phosphatase [Phycisphaerae bacterium]|nr:HAD family phosphatase [Phycisphaerae bacterium]